MPVPATICPQLYNLHIGPGSEAGNDRSHTLVGCIRAIFKSHEQQVFATDELNCFAMKLQYNQTSLSNIDCRQ